MENILNIENWYLMGACCLKMLSFFWPIIVIPLVMSAWSNREEAK